jgi:hypothetical protein
MRNEKYFFKQIDDDDSKTHDSYNLCFFNDGYVEAIKFTLDDVNKFAPKYGMAIEFVDSTASLHEVDSIDWVAFDKFVEWAKNAHNPTNQLQCSEWVSGDDYSDFENETALDDVG